MQRIRKANAHEDLAYHRDMLNVPLDTNIVPIITDLLLKLIVAERNVLVNTVAGLKLEVNHYKNLLLTEEEVEVKMDENGLPVH